MPIAPAVMATCTRCGTTGAQTSMLYDDQGSLICGACQARGESAAGMRKRVMNMTMTPPILSVMAYLSFLIPFLNLIAPALFAGSAIWGAIGGIRLFRELNGRTDHGATQGAVVAMLVLAILTLVFAAIPLALQILGWIALATRPSYRF
jgi:hypothetical protein